MKIVDHNNFWLMADNPISKAGIYPYLGSQISNEYIPDKLYNVLRPSEEIGSEASLNSLQLLPIVDDHAMLGSEEGMVNPEQKGIHGVIGENVYLKDGTVYADLKIFSEALKEEIANGKKQLSLGYFCDYDPTPGEYNGQHYDAIQRNLRGNHLALVEEGRMGADVRIMDSDELDNQEIMEEVSLPPDDSLEEESQIHETERQEEPVIDSFGKDPAFEEYLKGERDTRAKAYYSGPYDAAFEAYLRGE